jgi:hypothetical protein
MLMMGLKIANPLLSPAPILATPEVPLPGLTPPTHPVGLFGAFDFFIQTPNERF